MANQEHVDLLRRGAAEWNQWRNEHPKVHTDLTGAELTGTELTGAELTEANLSRAKLSGANLIRSNLFGAKLRGANLTETNLGGATLRGATLTKAELTEADLRQADLSEADLSWAHLIWANLSGANLSRVNLSGAVFFSTTLAESDLRSVKGLVEIRHEGPSIIQLHSIQLPQDGSTLHFLRNVGIPDEWIDFYRASMMHPIQYHSCFISYASDNEGIAKRLHADLQASGVRCWFAPHDLKPGDGFA